VATIEMLKEAQVDDSLLLERRKFIKYLLNLITN